MPITLWLCCILLIIKNTKSFKITRKRYYGNPNKLKTPLDWHTVRHNVTFESCSLQTSSLVKQFLDKDFFPIFESHGAKVSENCPFNPNNDAYGMIQARKTYTGNYYKCEVCGKQFVDEFYLDKHMQNRHAQLSEKNNKYCLSDFCDIFRCDLHMRYPIIASQQPACVDKQVRILQHKCQNIIRNCMDSNDHKLYDALFYSVCSTLTCNKFYKQFEDLSPWTVFLISVGIPVAIFTSIFLIWYICEEVSAMGEPSSPKKSRRRREDEITYAYDYTGRLTMYSAETMRHRRRDRPEGLYSRDKNNHRIYPASIDRSNQDRQSPKTKFDLSPVSPGTFQARHNQSVGKNANGFLVRQFSGTESSINSSNRMAWAFPQESSSPHSTKHMPGTPSTDFSIQMM